MVCLRAIIKNNKNKNQNNGWGFIISIQFVSTLTILLTIAEGSLVGNVDGSTLGVSDGIALGELEGSAEGVVDGSLEGNNEGWNDDEYEEMPITLWNINNYLSICKEPYHVRRHCRGLGCRHDTGFRTRLQRWFARGLPSKTTKTKIKITVEVSLSINLYLPNREHLDHTTYHCRRLTCRQRRWLRAGCARWHCARGTWRFRGWHARWLARR